MLRYREALGLLPPVREPPAAARHRQFGQADLDASRSGPIIIKERVRAIGGQLAIDSAPGRGARLEVLVPQEVNG